MMNLRQHVIQSQKDSRQPSKQSNNEKVCQLQIKQDQGKWNQSNAEKIDKKIYQEILSQEKHIIQQKSHAKLKEQYYNFFKQKNIIPDPQNFIPIQPSDQEFKKHKIKYLKGNKIKEILHSYDSPYIVIKNIERQGTIVIYNVIIAVFELDITLLNIAQVAKIQQRRIGIGSFGSVRIQSQNKRMFAVKRQLFQNKYHLNEFNMMANKDQINQAITQLAIYKICSLFQIGPAVETQIGFDLICYRDCIQFHIEMCMKIEYISKDVQKNKIYVDERIFEKQIKQCLLVLHFYRIIHKDIKPANILFSIKYNKYVLTDFGISHPVLEKVGYRSKTHRQGTLLFMSKQMRQIGQGKTGYVHLYGNDVRSLQISLRKQWTNQKIVQGLKQFKQKWQQKSQQNIKYEYEYLKLKYYCIKPDSNMEQVQNYWVYMNNIRREQLITIVDKSIQYHKIKRVYEYLSKSQDFKESNLENLRIQSESIKNINIDPNIKTNTQLHLENKLRVYGYSQQVKDMIIKLKLQHKYNETLKMVDKIIDKNREVNQRDRIFGNHANYVKKIKKQLVECESKADYEGMFNRYMIILQYGNKEEQIYVIQKLKMIKYKQNKQQKIQQMIEVNYIEKKKEKLKQFIQLMEVKDEQREKIITKKNLNYKVANIYNYMGKYKKALQYYIKSEEMDKQLQGQQHPYITDTYIDIGFLLMKMGNNKMAFTYFTKCLNMNISLHGLQHPSIADVYNSIALVYNEMEDYEKALQYYTKSLNMNISFYGQQHHTVAGVYNNIAGVYVGIGDYEKALTYFNKSLDMYRSFQLQQHPSVADFYNNIALASKEMGKYEEALQYYTKSLKMKISSFGQQHPSVADSYNNIAVVYDMMGQYQTSSTYYIKSLNMKLSFYGQHHPQVADTYNNLASLYQSMEKFEMALTYYSKCLNIELQIYGQQYPKIASTYNNISMIQLSLSHLGKSVMYCFKSLKIRSNLSMMQYPQIVHSYYQLSHIFHAKTKYIKSLHYAYLGLDIFIKFHALDHPQSPNFLSLLALIYYKMNRFIQSYFIYSFSCQILVKYFPIHHKEVRNAKNMMNIIGQQMPSLIHNYKTNIQFMDEIRNKYSQLPKHLLIQLLFAKKQQLIFEQNYRNKRDKVEYLKCVIEIYLCYKYLKYLRQLKKARDSMLEELSQLEQFEGKSNFREFIQEISHQEE